MEEMKIMRLANRKKANSLRQPNLPVPGDAMEKVNLREKLAQIHEHYHPHIVGEVNDAYVKLVKLKGEFIWHHHEHEDELFLVVRGRLLIQFRDGDLWLDEGEFCVVPRGVEHRPVAPEEVHVMLFEPKTTLNTGNVVNERTRAELPTI
jgi:mannose-6-phosphate isomerase-like protein (cupin superfamily)